MTSERDILQEMVKAEMRKVYSETVVEHDMNHGDAGNKGSINGFARVNGPCVDNKDTIEKLVLAPV